jgi:hypothetical protein
VLSAQRDLTLPKRSSRSLSLLSRVLQLWCRRSPAPALGLPIAECPFPGCSKSDCLLCGLFPFDVFPNQGSHIIPRVTSLWVTLPSQRFARSQGFAPPWICQPYSMLVPSLGFYPSGLFPTRGAVCSLKHRYPLAVYAFTLSLPQFIRLCQLSRTR